MNTFTRQPKPTRKDESASPARPRTALSGRSREVDLILHLHRTIGNQAVRRLLKDGTKNLEASSASNALTRFGRDFSPLPLYMEARTGIQPKHMGGIPGDVYEREADRIAEHVMRPQTDSTVQRRTKEETPIQTEPPAGTITPSIQRRPEPEKDEEAEPFQTKRLSNDSPLVHTGLQARIQSLKRGGEIPPESNRPYFDSGFGKVHAGRVGINRPRSNYIARPHILPKLEGRRIRRHIPGPLPGHHAAIFPSVKRQAALSGPTQVRRAPQPRKTAFPLKTYSAKTYKVVWLVTSPKAYLLTPPPGLRRLSKTVPPNTLVYPIDTKVIYGKRNTRKVYVKVERVLPHGASGSPKVYGWTARSNLHMLGSSLRYLLSTRKRKGRNISFRQFADRVVKKATGQPPSKWFNNFVYSAFLGRVTASPIHRDLALHLKTAETGLAAKHGGKHHDPTIAGTALGLVSPPEPIKGARKSSTSSFFSMHFFGLAIDLDYSRNPHITDTPNDQAATAKVLPRAGLLVDGLRHRFVPKKLYTHEILKLDKVLEKYFSYLRNDAELKQRLTYAKRHRIGFWKNKTLKQARHVIRKDLKWVSGVWGRAQRIIRAGGFTNLRKELIKGIGLYWGGDFGDMMHFDMRLKGVGKKIDAERRK